MDPTAAEREDPYKVSEDAILDGLFYACDTENLGQVSASRLIEYLRNAISNGTEEFAGNLDDLSLILDPEGKDMEIGLTSFQEGIKEWISDIRRRSFVSVEDNFHSPVAVNCMESPQSTYSGHKRSPVTSTPNMSSDSVEGLGGVTPEKDWDRAGELIGTIEDLQLNNKRLMEQQNAIEAQMENTEEANNQLSVEIESLQKQLRSCQLIIEKGKEKDKENSELRQAVTEALEANKRLHTKISQLEKERALFEGNINEVHEKLLESQTELELLEGERRRLVQELAEQKQYCSDLHEIQGVKDDMIAKESSTKSTVIADLSSANDSLKREKSRLQSVVSELEANLLRAKRSELSEENRQLHHNGPILSSTPFARQSSLQQELQAQESFATKGLPSPMVGNQRNLDDSLDVDSINHSLLSTASLDSVNTTATFEKYSISATQLASEFNEKREKALRQIDELALFDQSPEMKDKREMLREQLTEDMDTFADKISSLCVKKKAAERRASKLLVTIKKLKEENKQLFEERGKAFQKLGTMSISNDEVNSRLSDLEGKLEQERRIVAEKDEKLKFLEQQLSATSQELLILREENESLSTSLESQRQLSSRLKDELSMLRKLQDEMEGLQTLSLVRIKELESELLKLKVDLNVEKRRSSTLEESIQLSVLKHSDELKDIFDTIPSTDAEVLNRSRQSPRTSSPGVTGHMVRTRLCDYITQADTARRMQGVGRRDSPDGKPFSDHELEDSLHPSYERIAKGQKLQQLNETPSEGWLDPSYERITKGQQQQEVNETPSEGWLDNEFYKLPSSSISSDSLSPTTSERSPPVVNERQDRQQIVDSLESPSGKLLHGTENIDTEKPQIVDSLESPSKENVQHVDTEKLTSSSQTELFNKLVSTGSQTDLVTEVCVADKATITEEDSQAESKDRRRKSGASAPPAVADKKGETASARDGAKESDSSSKLAVGVDKEKPATSLWRKKLSVAFKIPEEFDAYESATSMALESSVESKYFVDGVSLRVRPAPNEKEIEKQFRTLVLAFQTDQDTLNRRLEVQAHGRDVAESNMNKELQRTSDLLKGFEALCITKDMQEMLLMLKSQVELLRKSSKRVSSQTEQHGCVQQEARMSSGVEVMICHAENLSRHLERMREDLHELRLRERLTDVEPTGSDERLANGPTNLDSHQDGIVPSSVLASSQSETGTDSTRQNSLFNFVMAFHTTSMRAKDALRKFRLRTEASRQERATSESYKPETDEAEVVARESHNEESLEGRDTSNPVVLVDEPEEDKVEESETVIEEEGKEEESDHVQEQDLEEVEEPCPEEDGNEELSLEESMPPELPKRPSVCRRCTLAVFRFTILIIVFSAVVFIGTVVQYKDSHFTINPQYAMSKFYEYLQPFGQLIYYFEPPS